MKSILNITKVAILGIGLLAIPGFAQQSTNPGTDRPYGTADRTVGDDRGSGNWGWVGLLGLIGLMGLRRPTEYRTRTDINPNPMGSRT